MAETQVVGARPGRRFSRGLKAMVAAGVLAGVLGVAAALVVVVMIVGMFGTSVEVEEGIRDDLVAVSEPPVEVSTWLEEGEHIVWVIDEGGHIPRERSFDLDVAVEADDGTAIDVDRSGVTVHYRDSDSDAELAQAAEFRVPQDGTYRIRVRERQGSLPVQLVGLGEPPPFGRMVPWAVGAVVAFLAFAVLVPTGSALLLGAAMTWATRSGSL